jgi:hypothetical protein
MDKKYILVAVNEVIDIISFTDKYEQYDRWVAGFSLNDLTFINVSGNENAILGSTYSDGAFTKYNEPRIPVSDYEGRYAILKNNEIFYLKFLDAGKLNDFYTEKWESITNAIAVDPEEEITFLHKWDGTNFIVE